MLPSLAKYDMVKCILLKGLITFPFGAWGFV
jgi:hypothetical protein